MSNGIMKQIEEKLGLPSLTQVSDVLKNLPDEPKLRLVKQILDSAGKVKSSPQELEALLELIRLISSADMEQLNAIKSITSNLLKLIKYFPKEALKQLPIMEIIEEMRKTQT